MRRIRTLLLSASLCISNVIFAQTALKPSVFVDTKSEAYKKGILELKEYSNYDVYLTLQRNLKSGNSAAINSDLVKQAYITERVALTAGKYIIDNDIQRFEFEIGNNNQFIGEGHYVNKRKDLKSTYIFDAGRIKEIQIFNSEGRLRKKDVFKGNIIEGIVYGYGGKVEQRIETHTDMNPGMNQLVVTYHKNGKPSKEVNTMKNITKEYYQNGKVKLEMINSRERTTYEPDGKVSEKWYVTEKGSCKETYIKGVITEKSCENREIGETTVETYKNGKLTGSTVTNTRKKEVKTYDSTKKLLNTKQL